MNDISRFTTMSGGIDKAKEWQMELLMEKLRSKACQFKTFAETAKTVRMSMLEKRYPLDSVEKNQHQKCLDSLQHSIKVTSLQSMIERLESLTRQLGLKFMVGPSGVDLFISSEMFYLEIILDTAGSVKDVKVHHEGKVEQQSCIELVNCLSMGDFSDFTAQLEGLSSIYQINAEKKIKCKAFSALQALEADLSTLAQLQTFIKEPFNLLHKSPVGILEKRKGGHAMKLTYFVSPYDLLNKEKGISEPLTVETVTSKSLGYSVTICMEGSTVHKLQTTTIISVNRNLNGKNSPSYATLGNQNSAILPACFVLRLNNPLPMCVSLARRIHQVTDMECGDLSSTHPIMSLITQHVSAGQLDCAHNKGLFVTLPEQHHCYFMTESKSMEGVLVSSIPFAHPCHVPQILVYLRQQALFNSVVASCIRTCSKQDIENMIMFEVSALSWQHLSVSLEHPLEESMATAEIDLTDICNVSCRIHTPASSSPGAQGCADPASELASKVFQRCLSIPVTMRTVLRLWDEQMTRKNHLNSNENFSLPLGSVDPGGHGGGMGSQLADFGGLNSKVKHEPGGGGGGHGLSGISLAHPHQGMFLNDSLITGAAFSPFPGAEAAAGLLGSMEINALLAGGHPAGQPPDKPAGKRQNKRKASEELWKNPKRKSGEDSELMAETSSSDSTSMSTPTSHDAASEPGIATPNSALGFHSDLELSGLDAAELIGSSDKIAAEFDCAGELDDLGEMEDMLSMSTAAKPEPKAKKSREDKKAALLELPDSKGLVPPSVSITPISSAPPGLSTVFSGMGLDRRPGIEIIPITSAPPAALPSSITITPISSAHAKPPADERGRDRKSSKSKGDDRSKLEKRRKRKKNEGPMGPPDKLPPKQDPLTKPVSVSIKPAGSPPPCATPTSPSSMLRKFNSSPLGGKSSPSMLKPSAKSGLSATHQSPKHSPAHVSSSPKHSALPAIASPKSHGTSPKHPSASGTGKPSMSALKSAANSPSGKAADSFKLKSAGKESSGRDRDKKFSSNAFSVSNPKVKSSSVKLKQLDLSAGLELQAAAQAADGLPSPSGTVDLSKAASLNQVRNRKGSLSAVIDKLKSAQHCGAEPEGPAAGKSGGREGRAGSLSSKAADAKVLNKIGEAKNSEYMVKPSSDGMKITINKTRMKDSSKLAGVAKAQSSGGTGSPKTHTGLKPGVNSGPASKKPQQLGQKSSGGGGGLSSAAYASLKGTGGSTKVVSSSKGGSGAGGASKSTSKLSGSPKSSGSGDPGRNKDGRPRVNKGAADKSMFGCSKGDGRRGSPTSRDDRDDNERAFKLLPHAKIEPAYPTSLMMEGMIKALDTNFQIPKLSARTGDADKKASANKVNASFPEPALNNVPRTVDSSKMYDMIAKNDLALPKYPISLAAAAKPFENNLDPKLRNSLVSMSSTSPLLPSPLATNALSYTSSSSPKRGLVAAQAALKDLGADSLVSLAGADLGPGAPEPPEPKAPKLKELSGPALAMAGMAAKDQDLAPNCKLPGYPVPTKAFSLATASFTDTTIKPVDTAAKFPAPQLKPEDKKLPPPAGKSSTSSQEAAEMLLDFSSNSISKPLASERSLPLMSVHKTTSPLPLGPLPAYPASPSVSVHIVKSPVPSPRVNPSPHSVSPCITDDELMDEALVGLGK